MGKHVFPAWKKYFLLNPLRKLSQNPDKILAPYIKQGMTALDFGCGAGYFSLPMAKMVGVGGKVICVDVQDKMLESVKSRAGKAGLAERIALRKFEPVSCGLDGLNGKVDFALAFAVVHEVPDAEVFFRALRGALASGGELLVAEPLKRVTQEEFNASMAAAQVAGFTIAETPQIAKTRAALLL